MRTIALHPDFDAILFWRDEQGQGVADECSLPLTDGCRAQLSEFYRWFTELHLTSDEKRSPLDARLFDERGIDLWKRVRAELEGRYGVVYYSQELAEYFETPELLSKAREAADA
jgi:hypothetical protein